MRIGVITFYKVLNFGAALQAVSTYCYLKNQGHEVFFINYRVKGTQKNNEKNKSDVQWNAQLEFLDSIIVNQTEVCETAEDVIEEVYKNKIEGIIVGSDALLQHHPFLSRLRLGRRKPFYILKVSNERLFPNLFWGCGLADRIPMALMSVSSQNSAFRYFMPWTRHFMRKTLNNMRYISVRDTWTKDMLKAVLKKDVPVTPDPVFAFNQNVNRFIPTREEIIKKFHLPDNYVLFSFFGQVLSLERIAQLKSLFNRDGICFVKLPMLTGNSYDFDADLELKTPLSPIDWYALIKYSKGYIGSNMHPIVVCLHNSVPCFSFDNWGRTNFCGKKVDDYSSKIRHIINYFGIDSNYQIIDKGMCDIQPQYIYDMIKQFPVEKIKTISAEYLNCYNKMMDSILCSLK